MIASFASSSCLRSHFVISLLSAGCIQWVKSGARRKEGAVERRKKCVGFSPFFPPSAGPPALSLLPKSLVRLGFMGQRMTEFDYN